MSSFDVLDAMETAIQAIAAGNAEFPACERNQPLERAFAALGSGTRAYANLVDGDTERLTEALGASSFGYENRQTALLELMTKHADEATRRAALKTILTALDDAMEADRTLGGIVGYWGITGIQRLDQATDGDPELSGMTVEIAADYVSDRPF